MALTQEEVDTAKDIIQDAVFGDQEERVRVRELYQRATPQQRKHLLTTYTWGQADEALDSVAEGDATKREMRAEGSSLIRNAADAYGASPEDKKEALADFNRAVTEEDTSFLDERVSSFGSGNEPVAKREDTSGPHAMSQPEKKDMRKRVIEALMETWRDANGRREDKAVYDRIAMLIREGKVTEAVELAEAELDENEWNVLHDVDDEAAAYFEDPEAHGDFGNCADCGRDLTNPGSVKRGVGPVCNRRHG